MTRTSRGTWLFSRDGSPHCRSLCMFAITDSLLFASLCVAEVASGIFDFKAVFGLVIRFVRISWIKLNYYRCLLHNYNFHRCFWLSGDYYGIGVRLVRGDSKDIMYPYYHPSENYSSESVSFRNQMIFQASNNSEHNIESVFSLYSGQNANTLRASSAAAVKISWNSYAMPFSSRHVRFRETSSALIYRNALRVSG